MTHAERCPICYGSGKVSDPDYGKFTGAQPTKTCHGCGGSGWVTVN